MGRLAVHIYTEPARIQHLRALVAERLTNGYVVLQLKDGSSRDGIVCEHPNVT